MCVCGQRPESVRDCVRVRVCVPYFIGHAQCSAGRPHEYAAVHSADRQEAARLEEGERGLGGGQMVGEGRQESGEEAEEDGRPRGAGEGYIHQ